MACHSPLKHSLHGDCLAGRSPPLNRMCIGYKEQQFSAGQALLVVLLLTAEFQGMHWQGAASQLCLFRSLLQACDWVLRHFQPGTNTLYSAGL